MDKNQEETIVTEPSKNSVYMRLAKSRVDLQAMQMMKSGNNKFAGYFYFELSDFLPTVTKILFDNGLCGAISFYKEHAELRIVAFEDGSEVVFSSPMSEANLKGCHPVQNLGAVQTYLRRYLYMAALEIVEQEIFDSKTLLTKTDVFVEKASKKGVTPTAGCWEPFNESERRKLEGVAEEINEAVQFEVKDAVRLFYNNHLTQEEQIAIWSLISSKDRSAIKKSHDTAKIADSIAGQA